MKVLCIKDYWDNKKWEIYEVIDWFLCNTITHEEIEEQEWFRRHPEHFIDILPEIEIGKTKLEIQVDALNKRFSKIFDDKEYHIKELKNIDEEMETIAELIKYLTELWADH